MPSPHYSIKPMTRSEFSLVIDWAAAEGWNPGWHDRNCFYAADAEGFLMGFLAGEPISAISAVKYGKTFGFIGFYLVQPAFRGCGYGFQIWQAGLDYLTGRNIGLDGVIAQQANYAKAGFKLAHRNIRYRGIKQPAISSHGATEGIVALPSLPLRTVMAYDRLFFPDDRSAFLTSWITQPQSRALGLIHDQVLAGYGVLRPCREGYKIGPLFADTPQFAEALLLALTAYVPPNQPFYLDVPEANTQAVALAQAQGMSSVFETARMYSQKAPELPLNQIFGITTFELG
ncbi:MAG: GNAT family N-acetyltransferase [Phormidesmis sp. RL_2_1]|nr:GNAT family N-acetyltransferase [Phormidesmis sp. RL_2_1]